MNVNCEKRLMVYNGSTCFSADPVLESIARLSSTAVAKGVNLCGERPQLEFAAKHVVLGIDCQSTSSSLDEYERLPRAQGDAELSRARKRIESLVQGSCCSALSLTFLLIGDMESTRKVRRFLASPGMFLGVQPSQCHVVVRELKSSGVDDLTHEARYECRSDSPVLGGIEDVRTGPELHVTIPWQAVEYSTSLDIATYLVESVSLYEFLRARMGYARSIAESKPTLVIKDYFPDLSGGDQLGCMEFVRALKSVRDTCGATFDVIVRSEEGLAQVSAGLPNFSFCQQE